MVDARVDLYGPNEKEYKSAPDKSENVLQSAETDAGRVLQDRQSGTRLLLGKL